MGGCVGVDVSSWVVVDTPVFLPAASELGCDILANGDRLNIMRSFDVGPPEEVGSLKVHYYMYVHVQ